MWSKTGVTPLAKLDKSSSMRNDSLMGQFTSSPGRTTLPPRLVGRFAAALFLGSGALNLLSLLAPTRPGLHNLAQIVVSLVSMAAGLVAWSMPWDRPGFPSTLWLAPIGLALISAGHFYGGGPNASVGLFYAVLFVWIGLSHGRWASLRMAPLALAAYLVPLIKPELKLDTTTAVISIPLVVLVGEIVGWVSSRLRSTEELLSLEREAGRRLSEIEEMKTTFLTAASHEVRTPLVSIKGYAELLKRKSHDLSPEEVEDFADRLAVNTERLDRVIRGLLDADRISRGLIDALPEPTDLWGLLARVVGKLDVRNHHVEVDSEVPVARIDAGLTERILENLLANALTYSSRGTGAWVSIENESAGLLITVKDEGPAISDDQRAQIFEPFERAAGHDHSPGLGLGLWIVRRFAELQGGTAWVEDRPGGGNAFKVRLPVSAG